MTDIGYNSGAPSGSHGGGRSLAECRTWAERRRRLKEIRRAHVEDRCRDEALDDTPCESPARAVGPDPVIDLVTDRLTGRGRFYYAIAVVIPVLVMAYTLVPLTDHVNVPRFAVYGGALLVGLIAVRWALEEPLFLLLLITAYIPFQRQLAGDFEGLIPAFNYTNALLLLLVTAWVVRARNSSDSMVRYHQLDIPILLFVFVSSVALFRAEISLHDSPVFVLLNPWKRWMVPFFIYFAVVNMVKTKKEIRLILLTVCFTTAVIGIFGFKEGYIDKAHYGKLAKRRISVVTTPNDLGALFAYYIPYLFAYLALNWHSLRYHLLWPLIAVCVRATVLTYSRGGQLALGVGLLALLAVARIKFFVLIVIPVAVICLTNPDVVPPQLIGRMDQTVDEEVIDHKTGEVVGGGLDKSSQARLEIWSTAIRMIKDKPLLGFGYGTFSKNIPKYDPTLVKQLPDGSVIGRDAHSAYLRLAVEQGLPALILLLLVFGLCGYMAIYVYRQSDDHFYRIFSAGYFGGLIGLIIANIFGSRFETNEITVQFWILTACLAVVYRVIRERKHRVAMHGHVTRTNRRRELLGLPATVPAEVDPERGVTKVEE